MEANAFTKFMKNLGGVISKNSPVILTGLSVGGLITTVIFAVRATPKAMYLIECKEEELTNGQEGVYHPPITLSGMEIVKLTWKCYIPAACMGAVTIACMIGSVSISQRRNAALATVYGLTETAFREYKDKVVETIGKNKELKVRDDISGDRVKANPASSAEVIITGKGEVLCLDSLSGRYFKSDIEAIRRVVNQVNKELMTNMWMSLNELYFYLGLQSIKVGDQLGWDVDKGLLEVSFSTQLADEGQPCLVINYDVEPRHFRG